MHQEREALPVRRLERRLQPGLVGERDDERRVGALVAQVDAAVRRRSASRATPWRASSATASSASAVEARLDVGVRAGERLLERGLAHHRLVREAHAVGRQHAGERMDEDALHRRARRRRGRRAGRRRRRSTAACSG